MPQHRFLLAEDDTNDAALVRRAVRRRFPDAQVDICTDGEEARAYLESLPEEIDPPVALVVTDLKMPRRDGLDLLRWFRNEASGRWQDPRTHPVVVFSSSSEQADIDAAREAGANGYVQKPVDPQLFGDALVDILEIWLLRKPGRPMPDEQRKSLHFERWV